MQLIPFYIVTLNCKANTAIAHALIHWGPCIPIACGQSDDLSYLSFSMFG